MGPSTSTPGTELRVVEVGPALPEHPTLTHGQKLRLAALCKKAILLACDPDQAIAMIAENMHISQQVVEAAYERFSVYSRQQMSERARLLAADRKTQTAIMFDRLELLFEKAMSSGQLKVGLECIKQQKELLDLGVKRRRVKKDDDDSGPIRVRPAEKQKMAQLSDEELIKRAQEATLSSG